ncbi:MAG: hypothetical protein ABI172_11550 [Ginsengibacter sp.]
MRRKYFRSMAISLFIIAISVINFARLPNSGCIRAIHVVTLLVCGMAIGIFMTNLFGLLLRKNK